MSDQPKICINCKHIGRNGSRDATRYRCFAPANIISKGIDLVTGESYNNFYHETCYSARLDSPANCGQEGRWFEPIPPQPPGFGCPPQSLGAADLLSQLDKMK